MADPTYYDLSVTGAALSTAITKAGTALQSSDIGVSVQGYDANTVKKNVANTFSVEQIISANTTNPALRITQTGAGDCIRIEDDTNPDQTPFVVDASGRVIIGNPTSVATFAYEYPMQIHASRAFAVARWTNDTFGVTYLLGKSRGTAPGSYTVLNSGDSIGSMLYAGSDGTAMYTAAEVKGAVDATPGTNSIPGRLVFATTAVGDTSATEAFRVTSAQDMGIGITAPSARVHVVKTTEQLRLGYDATKYLSITVDSAGDALLAPVGALKFGTWSSNSDAAVNGYITIKDAAGNSRKLATIA